MGKNLERLRQRLAQIYDINAAANLLEWDQQTYMPPGGADERAYQLATLRRLAHELLVSDETGEALEAARQEVADPDSDSDEARLVWRTGHEYEKSRKVPGEWVSEFNRTTSLAHATWQEARAEADFGRFAPALRNVVELRRQYVSFFAPYDHPYDPLLDDFELGMKTAQVQAVFDALRPRQVALVKAIAEHGSAVQDDFLHQPFDEGKQWQFGLEIAQRLGYDLQRGRQDRSAHPFTTSFGLGDVRITTRLDPNDLTVGLFATLHEAGHAMYEQGISPSLARSPLADGASLGVHESQSRLWENLVGRSRPFWQAFYPRLQEYFPEQLGEVDLERFYRAINKVQPSFIRVEADEATYNLHIMLRFELEQALVAGDLAVADLPLAWNEKMQDYLGLTPPDDAKGVLQDVHWSAGLLGYFPTYALGNLVAAQLWARMAGDIPDLEAQIAAGELSPLLGWMREHVHRHGAKFAPAELVRRVTGNDLTPEPYLDYLQSKFGAIYGL